MLLNELVVEFGHGAGRNNAPALHQAEVIANAPGEAQLLLDQNQGHARHSNADVNLFLQNSSVARN